MPPSSPPPAAPPVPASGPGAGPPSAPTVRAELRAGLLAVLPAVVASAPFGLLLGALAAARGLSPLEVALMSALVFAGGAQFAVVEIWLRPVPVVSLTLTTLLINSRHVLMGASIARALAGFRPAQQALALHVMADEVWALAEDRARRQPLTPAFWLGLGLGLYPVWVASSAAGAMVGGLMGDPARLGFDFAFTAIFIGLIAGFARRGGGAALPVILASAAASALLWLAVGPPWHIAAGALAGIGAAVIQALWQRLPEEPS